MSKETKIINGDPDQFIQRPAKYSAPESLLTQSIRNFWIPQDVPMMDDKAQWESGELTPEQEHLFRGNMSYLTTGDGIVPFNLSAIMAHITAPEVRKYLQWQEGEETNHVASYEHILTTIGLDPTAQGEIFDLYKTEPALLNKIEWNQSYTKNLKDCQNIRGEQETNIALLQDLFSYLIFEYIFFPCGFSQVFAIARKGIFLGAADQYRYIWRDETLHSQNGIWLIKQIIAENPELWNAKMKEFVRVLVAQAINLETEYANATFPQGDIPGHTKHQHIQYAKLLADDLLKTFDLPTSFNITEHPIPWINQFASPNEANFFESKVTDYNRTGLRGGELRIDKRKYERRE